MNILYLKKLDFKKMINKSFSEVRVKLEIAVQPHTMHMYACTHTYLHTHTHTRFHSSLGGILVTF